MLSKTPIDGIVVFAIPRHDLTTRSQHGFITGYDVQGHPVPIRVSFIGTKTTTSQIVYYRSCPLGSNCYP